MPSPLFEKFGAERRWVNWKPVAKDGKTTKVPVSYKGKLAKSNDPSTWMTYDEVKSSSSRVGLMATPDKLSLLVDLDACLKDGKLAGPIKTQINAFIVAAHTYTEISPSKTGLHFFFALSAPFEPAANKRSVEDGGKIEVYTHGRFFTATEAPFGAPRNVRTISPEEAEKLLSILGYPWKVAGSGEKESPQTSHASPLPQTDILTRMFAAKNGAKIRALYDGDISAYGKDDSSADLALLNHLAFWTGKDKSLMESLWLSSPLGRRAKTQKRADYRIRSIATAVANCTEVYTPRNDIKELARSDFKSSKKSLIEEPGKIEFLTQTRSKAVIIILATENIVRLLRSHPEWKGRIRIETFRGRMEIRWDAEWKPVEEHDIISIQGRIASTFPFFQMVSKAMVFDAITMIAAENAYDSASEYLKSLVWDKEPRLDIWLTKTLGVPPDAYHRAVASNWIKGIISRVMWPGSKFDYVLVLEGPQGTRKSTLLYELGRDWHVETTATTDNKDFFMQLQGKAIIEFAEGETLSRTEIKRLKAIITMQSDKYRPPYGRLSQEFPRRCVFAMTTNESEYLKDDTGNRRWLPVTLRLPEADVEWMKANRDQLYAEAYYRTITLGEPIYEFPKDDMLAEQAKRKTLDPNADIIISWYLTDIKAGDRVAGITITQAYKAMSGGYIHKPLTKSDEMNIAAILRDSLGLEKRQVMIGGMRTRRWFLQEGVKDPMEGVEISVLDQLRDH